MKKLLYLLLVLPLAFAACSDDDDNYDNSRIVGIWALESAEAISVITNQGWVTNQITTDIQSIVQEGGTMEFRADGTFFDIDAKKANYKLKGNTLIFYNGKEEIGSIAVKFDADYSFTMVGDATETYQDKYDHEDVNIGEVIVSQTYRRINE